MPTADLLTEIFIFSAAFVFKPLHMFFALFLIYWLRNFSGTYVKLFRIGLAVFYIGEFACASNFVLYGHESVLLDLIHDSGMVIFSILFILASFEMLKQRFFEERFLVKNCFFINFCPTCTLHERNGCRAINILFFVHAAIVILAFIPISHQITPLEYKIFAFNQEVNYSIDFILQLVHYKIIPIFSIVFAVISFIKLAKNQKELHFLFFCAAGCLLYSLMIFMLEQSFSHQLYLAAFWEEATELIAVFSIFIIFYFYGLKRKETEK